MINTNNKSRLSETKESLIAEIKQRVQEKILEPENAALLIKLISAADDNDEAQAIAALGTTYKPTGFHFDKRLEKHFMSNTIKYFVKNKELSFGEAKEGEPIHRLIIGDNYDALNNLLIQFKGDIDAIYIDPPYGKDSMGEFAKTNYNNSITRDNLLSMLYFRLQIAKQLLSESGVIFCSIDDKNQAYVKCLFDEIFGEKNFLGQLILKTATDNNPSQITTEHEYMLCYALNAKSQGKWIRVNRRAILIKEKYDEIKELNLSIEDQQKLLRKWINENKDSLKGVTHYKNVDEQGVYSSSGNSSNPHPGGYEYEIIHPKTKKPCPNPANGWRWPETTFWEYDKKGEILWGKDHTTQPHVKKRIETANENLRSLIYEDNRAATQLLDKLFETKDLFSNPKPHNVLARILDYTTKNDSKVLDFFAGSGTTGHAVLDLNKEDGGKRTFILCQINEPTEKALNGIAYDVTTKRLKRIMTGECYDGNKDFKWAKENIPYGGKLDVYEIKEVSNTNAVKGATPFDVIDETLYGKEGFKTQKEKIEWVCGNFAHTQLVEPKDD
jgi:adenine-specific DNA-methyltransferase